jgi:hypothetical protein
MLADMEESHIPRCISQVSPENRNNVRDRNKGERERSGEERGREGIYSQDMGD